MAAATNRLALSFIEESTFGSHPGTGAHQAMRFTSESLKQDTGTTTSSEIQSDRQVPTIVRSSVGASGDTGFELYMGGALETLMTTGAMQSTGEQAGGSAVSATATVITVTGDRCTYTCASNPFGTYAAGEWVKITGAATAANNGWFRIIVAAAGYLIVDDDAGTGTMTAEEAATCAFDGGDFHDNGTNMKSYTIEKEWEDLSNIFQVTNGCTVDGMSLTVPTDGIVTGSLSYTGSACTSATSTAGTGTNTADATGSACGSTDNVISFRENHNQQNIVSFNMTLANNLRQRTEVGNASAVSIGAGSLAISGSFQVYFAAGDPVLSMDRYLAGTDTSVDIVFSDGPNQIAIDLPRVRLTSGQRVAGGQNQDVIMEIGFEAFKHETLGHTIRYIKW